MKIKNLILSIICLLTLMGCDKQNTVVNITKVNISDIDKQIKDDEFNRYIKIYSIYYCTNENSYQVSIDTMKVGEFPTLELARESITNRVKNIFKNSEKDDKELQDWVDSQPKVCGQKIQ